MGNNSNHSTSKEARERQKRERLGEEKYNNQGCLMKVVEYNKSSDIVVEFQDERKTRIKCAYKEFAKGSIKNPYHPTIYGVGMKGSKYLAIVNGKVCKEYYTWKEGEDKEMMIGTSAQKLQAVYPELVGVNSETGQLSVDYSKLSVVALKAVDKLYDENQMLKERLERLERILGV